MCGTFLRSVMNNQRDTTWEETYARISRYTEEDKQRESKAEEKNEPRLPRTGKDKTQCSSGDAEH